MTEIRFHGRDVGPGVRALIAVVVVVFGGLVLSALVHPAPSRPPPQHPVLMLGMVVGVAAAFALSTYLRTRVLVRVDPARGVLECSYVPQYFLLIPRIGILLMQVESHPLSGLRGVYVERVGSRHGIVLEYPDRRVPLARRCWYGEAQVQRFAAQIRNALAV
jgi:hypothetical protein